MSNDSAPSLYLPRIIIPRRHVDDRGSFSEIFHEKRLRDIGITCRFVQDNQSSSKRAGTLRGLHFQLPPAAQAKLISHRCRRRCPMWFAYVRQVCVDRALVRVRAPTLRSHRVRPWNSNLGRRRSRDVQSLRLLCIGARQRNTLERPGHSVSMAGRGCQHHRLRQGSPTSAAQGIRESVCL
jgi:dTDP-4-dehydrorhamnose 3,5-epimerase